MVLKNIAAIQTQGTQALANREEAMTKRTRVSLRMQTWKEDANAARRSVENMLDAYAIDNGLPRDYSDGFFPASARRGSKKAITPPPEPTNPPTTSAAGRGVS